MMGLHRSVSANEVPCVVTAVANTDRPAPLRSAGVCACAVDHAAWCTVMSPGCMSKLTMRTSPAAARRRCRAPVPRWCPGSPCRDKQVRSVHALPEVRSDHEPHGAGRVGNRVERAPHRCRSARPARGSRQDPDAKPCVPACPVLSRGRCPPTDSPWSRAGSRRRSPEAP